MEPRPTIFVVDDDPGVSRAIQSVGQLLDLPVKSFASGGEFLGAYSASQPGCLVLDIKLPDTTGLELQQRLAEQEAGLPIIMISGHADVRIAVEAMSKGALTLLEKPFRLDDLIAKIRQALKLDEERRAVQARQSDARSRLARLTPREREVLELLIAGNSNKQMAVRLGLSLRAVEDRRGRLMKKLAVRSLAELVRLVSPNVA